MIDVRGARRAAGPLALAAVGAGALAAVAARRRFDREVRDRVDRLHADAEAAGDRRFAAADVEGLPAPARRYLEAVVPEGRPHVRTAWLRQRGEFRLGGEDAPWRPIESTQHVSTRPPAFVWDGDLALYPFLPIRVVDAYARGEGLLRARLASALPIASAGPGPGMDEGELVRFLAEAAWYPTALVPGHGVTWEAIDDRSARATIEHRGVTASAVFGFDDRGLIERVTAERYRQEDDADGTWVGRFRAYEAVDGIRVPTEAEVAWRGPTGEVPYWRGRVERIDYRPAVRPDGA